MQRAEMVARERPKPGSSMARLPAADWVRDRLRGAPYVLVSRSPRVTKVPGAHAPLAVVQTTESIKDFYGPGKNRVQQARGIHQQVERALVRQRIGCGPDTVLAVEVDGRAGATVQTQHRGAARVCTQSRDEGGAKRAARAQHQGSVALR